jgi:type III secretion protein R
MTGSLVLAQVSSVGSNPINTVILLGLLSLLPFLLMMTTSFLKFAVVFSILRNALGTQQVPPNPVLLGLAVMLSIYVMAPVGYEIYEALEPDLAADSSVETLSGQGASLILESLEKSKPPMKEFLARHAHPEEVEFFLEWAKRMGPEQWKQDLTQGDLIVLIPAFAISELTEAFAIGFLLFLPFLVIDMVISNILLAMGMHMLSPVVISLPFKLLLFVMTDGWVLLTRGLLQGYL